MGQPSWEVLALGEGSYPSPQERLVMNPRCSDCDGAVTRVDQGRDLIPTYRCRETGCRTVTTDPSWQPSRFGEGAEYETPAGGLAVSYSGPHAGILDDGRDSQFVNGGGGALLCTHCDERVLPTCTDLHDCPG